MVSVLSSVEEDESVFFPDSVPLQEDALRSAAMRIRDRDFFAFEVM